LFAHSRACDPLKMISAFLAGTALAAKGQPAV